MDSLVSTGRQLPSYRLHFQFPLKADAVKWRCLRSGVVPRKACMEFPDHHLKDGFPELSPPFRQEQQHRNCLQSPLSGCCPTALNLSCRIFGFLCYGSLASILITQRMLLWQSENWRKWHWFTSWKVGTPGIGRCPVTLWQNIYQISKYSTCPASKKLSKFHLE